MLGDTKMLLWHIFWGKKWRIVKNQTFQFLRLQNCFERHIIYM